MLPFAPIKFNTRYLTQPAERPVGDLFVTMLHRLDIPVTRFADNDGEFNELVV